MLRAQKKWHVLIIASVWNGGRGQGSKSGVCYNLGSCKFSITLNERQETEVFPSALDGM